MEFLEEETRPRFLFQSRPSTIQSHASPPHSQSQSLGKTTLLISLSLSSILFTLSIFSIQSEPFYSLLIWISLSLLVGPFAPSSLTCGDIRVGLGPTLPHLAPQTEQQTNPIELNRKTQNRKSKSQKPKEVSDFSGVNYNFTPVFGNGSVELEKKKDGFVRSEKKDRNLIEEERELEEENDGFVRLEKKDGNVVVEEEREWSEGDLELLKKLMVKNPVGKPGRWEGIAAGFKGRHRVESVIKKAKEMGEKKMNDEDSFARFLKDRKTLDKRAEMIEGDDVKRENEGGGSGVWSSGEDLALLNALKAFPKDVSMRWEKIAAAVPGKKKGECVKRVAELKREFRSSKASMED